MGAIDKDDVLFKLNFNSLFLYSISHVRGGVHYKFNMCLFVVNDGATYGDSLKSAASCT